MKIYHRLLMVLSLIAFNTITLDVYDSHDIFKNVVSAKIQVYPFKDAEKELRFNRLIQELRCPKCQNNNLADSNAGLAVDLKDIIYEKINEGETDEQIIAYLKQRYGDFISYRPPIKPSTWLLWFGPFAFLLIGGIFIFRFIRTRKLADTHSLDHESEHSHNDAIDVLNQWKS